MMLAMNMHKTSSAHGGLQLGGCTDIVLERHWDAYHLSDMVGDPAHPGVAWGRLDHLEGNRE